MENMDIYKKLSVTPNEARKEIVAGRLKGMTDINPMWRIKMLTETFGVCGFGWKYVITNKRLENGCLGQISAFVDIDLFVKIGDAWSEAIPGSGGSSFVANESKGLYQSDECFKMALTDAISVSCKALGMSADIYFSKDRTKYDALPADGQQKQATEYKELPWLNIIDKEKNFTREWQRLIALKQSNQTIDIQKLRENYKISKEVESKINELINQ